VGRQLFPPQYRCTLRYHEITTVVPGAVTYYQVKCNSLYDPNSTGTGHQPQGFDQLMGLYDHYTVLKSKITFRLRSPVTTSALVYQGLYIDDDTSATLASFSTACERPHAQFSGGNVAVEQLPPLSRSWDAVATFGPGTQADPNLQGTATSDPAELSYYTYVYTEVGVQSITMYLEFFVEYDAIFDELTSLATS